MKNEYLIYIVSFFLILFSIAGILTALERIDGSSITGYFSILDVAPKDFVPEEPAVVNQEAALRSLEQSQEDIASITALNLSTTFMHDAFFEANSSYAKEDYLQTIKLGQLIHYIKNAEMAYLDKIALTTHRMEELEKKGINTTPSSVFVQQAREALQNEQLDEVKEFLQQADAELERAEKEKARITAIRQLGRNFFLRYWWELLLLVTFVAVVSPKVVRQYRKKRLQKQITQMRQELQDGENYIKRLQKECFIDKKISTENYRERVSKYQERQAEIKHTLPVLEAQLKGERVKRDSKGLLKIEK